MVYSVNIQSPKKIQFDNASSITIDFVIKILKWVDCYYRNCIPKQCYYFMTTCCNLNFFVEM